MVTVFEQMAIEYGDRIDALEAENAALREFVAVSRELDALGTVTEDSPIELLERWREIAERYAVINHSLATDYGIPRTGEGVEG